MEVRLLPVDAVLWVSVSPGFASGLAVCCAGPAAGAAVSGAVMGAAIGSGTRAVASGDATEVELAAAFAAPSFFVEAWRGAETVSGSDDVLLSAADAAVGCDSAMGRWKLRLVSSCAEAPAALAPLAASSED